MNIRKLNRRSFVKTLLKSAGGLSVASAFPVPLFAQSSYNGKLLLTLQLDGGLDVTSFCDPKMNIPGEKEINEWARTAETLQAGNIPYAPVPGNPAFFEKYHSDILVINGVDAQTNSHSVGVVNNWSGRNAEGYPTVTSLMAATNAPELPMSYLNFGGFGDARGLIRSTRISNVSQIRNIIYSNRGEYNDSKVHRVQDDWDRIKALQIKNLEAMSQAENTPAGNLLNRQYYLDAVVRAESIKVFGDILPAQEDIQQGRSVGRKFYSTLHQQIQVSLLAFKSGVSVSADLHTGAFDTHVDHDIDHQPLIENVTDALDYLWSYAEEIGLADRVVLMIGSDFGRTPFYNEGEGKDHWPIGSYVIMEKNAGYTNRVIGETDGAHNTLKINPTTLARDDMSGITLKPEHVHKALRRHMGIEDSTIAQLFPFNATEDFDFFG